MPTAPGFGFCGPTYEAISKVQDASRAINLYPDPGIATSKNKLGLTGAPGLSLWTTLPTSPIRAFFAGAGRLFVVAGNKVYEVASDGSTIRDYGAIVGSTGGTAPAQLIANGDQLLLMDSSVPGVFNVSTSPVGIFPVLSNAWALEYLDTFYFALGSPGAATQNIVNQSATLNGTSWPALAVNKKTGTPDLALNIAVVNGQLWIFSQKNIEMWYDAGLSPFSLERVSGPSTINTGLLGQYTICKLGNTVFWLGASERGYAQVYRADGFLPVRVSNPAIENLIQSYQIQTSGTGQITAMTYEEEGQIFYMLTFPATAGNPNGSALVYDLMTGMWHERYHLNVDGVTLERPLYHCACSISGFGAATEPPVNFVGAWNSGKIYKLGLGYASDDGDARMYVRTAPHVSDQDRWTKHASLVISADCGTAQLKLEYSNDGGRTFTGGPYTISPSSEVPSRYKWNQLGRSRDRVYKVTMVSSTEKARFVDAYLNVNPGTEP